MLPPSQLHPQIDERFGQSARMIDHALPTEDEQRPRKRRALRAPSASSTSASPFMTLTGATARVAKIDDLSDELLLRILYYLDAASLVRFGATNLRHWRVAGDALLWKALYAAVFRSGPTLLRAPDEQRSAGLSTSKFSEEYGRGGSPPLSHDWRKAFVSERNWRAGRFSVSSLHSPALEAREPLCGPGGHCTSSQAGVTCSRPPQRQEAGLAHSHVDPQSNPRSGPARPLTLVVATPTFILTASRAQERRSDGMYPPVHVWDSGGLSEARRVVGVLQTTLQKPWTTPTTQRASCSPHHLAVQELQIDFGDPNRAAVVYSDGMAVVYQFDQEGPELRSTERQRVQVGRDVSALALAGPLLVTCTSDFTIDIWSSGQASRARSGHLQELRLVKRFDAFGAHWPACLTLRALTSTHRGTKAEAGSAQRYRLSVAYTAHLYPERLSVGLQEVDIAPHARSLDAPTASSSLRASISTQSGSTDNAFESKVASAPAAEIMTSSSFFNPLNSNKQSSKAKAAVRLPWNDGRRGSTSFWGKRKHREANEDGTQDHAAVSQATPEASSASSRPQSMSHDTDTGLIVVGRSDNIMDVYSISRTHRSSDSTPLLQPALSLAHRARLWSATGVRSVALEGGRCVSAGADGALSVWSVGGLEDHAQSGGVDAEHAPRLIGTLDPVEARRAYVFQDALASGMTDPSPGRRGKHSRSAEQERLAATGPSGRYGGTLAKLQRMAHVVTLRSRSHATQHGATRPHSDASVAEKEKTGSLSSCPDSVTSRAGPGHATPVTLSYLWKSMASSSSPQDGQGESDLSVRARTDPSARSREHLRERSKVGVYELEGTQLGGSMATPSTTADLSSRASWVSTAFDRIVSIETLNPVTPQELAARGATNCRSSSASNESAQETVAIYTFT